MDNRAELILSLRDEISSGLAPVNAALAQTKQQIADLGGGSKTASAGMASLAESGTGAGNALAMAGGHASLLLGYLAPLVGLTVSVAGGLALVKSGIEEITSFDLGAISTAAMMLSRANIEGIGAQQAAYGEYKAYVLSMYEALEAETQRHFASGKEMIAGFDAFARKGIYAAQEQAGAIGVITDAVKLLHRGYVDETIMQHEIQGLLEGHAGIRFKLAQQLKGMMGESWAEQIQAAAQDGTLIDLLQEKFKGLGVAAGDIQKNLMAQSTTLYTLIGQVGRGGLGGLYEDVVGAVSHINEYLREHKDSLISGIAQGWATIKWTIEQAAAASEKISIPNDPSKRTATQSAFAETYSAMKDAPGAVATGLGMEWELATRGVEGWLLVVQHAYGAVDDLDAKLGTDWKSMSAFITDSSFWHWAIDAEGAKQDIDTVKREIQGVIDLVSRAYTFVINAVVSGLPSWLGGGEPFVGPPAPAPQTQFGLTYDQTLKLAGQRAQGIVGLTDPNYGELELGRVPKIKTPKNNPALDAGKGGKGGGKDTSDATLATLQQKIDGLLQDIGKINDGLDAGVDAWAVKAIDDINKVAAKNAGNADVQKAQTLALSLVNQDADAKKQKIDDDFWLKAAKNAGDVFAGLNDQYDRDIKNTGNTAERKEQIWQDYNKMWFEAGQKVEKDMEDLHKNNLQILAQATPLLSDQLPIQSQLLEIEIKRNQADLALKLSKLQIWDVDQGYYRFLDDSEKKAFQDEQARADASRRDAQERKAWMTQGVSGGLQAYGADRAKEAETRDAQTAIDAMKGAEQWLGQTGGQALVDFLHGKKADLSKLFSDLGDSAVKQIFTMGVTKGFDFLGKGIGAAFGVSGISGKPTGSMTNPFYVVQAQGVGGNIGGSLSKVFSSGSDELDQSSKDFMKVLDQGSLALSDDAVDFGTTFSSASESLASICAGPGSELWKTSDNLGSMFTSANSELAQTGEGWGGMFEGAISSLAGMGGGGGGLGGGGGGIFGMIASGIGAVASFFLHDGGLIMHDGGAVYAHDGWPPLQSDERRIIGQVGEGMLSREDMSYLGGPAGFDAFRRSLRRGGGSALAPGSPGGGTVNNDHKQVHFHIGDIHINPPQDMTGPEAEQMVRRHILPAIEKVVGNRGLSLLG